MTRINNNCTDFSIRLSDNSTLVPSLQRIRQWRRLSKLLSYEQKIENISTNVISTGYINIKIFN